MIAPLLAPLLAASLLTGATAFAQPVTSAQTATGTPVSDAAAQPSAPQTGPIDVTEGTIHGAGVGASKAFNPDTSVNFLGLYQRSNNQNTQSSQLRAQPAPATIMNGDNVQGFSLQEAELQFISEVDPYFRANALFSLAPNTTGTYDLGPEEVFLETTSLPGITLRGGKFKAALGRHNQLHTHAYPFVDAPLINLLLLGGEGLNEKGVSAAVLMPTDWFMELTVQAMSNDNPILYNSPQATDIAKVAQLKQLWDLTDDLTTELNIYGTEGPNPFGATSDVYGADLVFKWRPTEGGKYHALIWSNEYLDGIRHGAPTQAELGGLASWLQWQFAERWWLQGRYEYVGVPQGDQGKQQRETVLLGLFPSEFSGFRLQYERTTSDLLPTDHAIAFQYNISIGAHPAHAY